jgi:cytochrome c553
MTRRWLLLFVAAFALFHCLGCKADRRRLSAKERAEFAPISKGINHASSLTLYEGLPHQTWEPEVLAKELATKKTIVRHEFPFYERPLPVAAGDVEALRRLSAAGESFAPYLGPKNCGGYHPDYCLAWKDAETTYELLICFGCHEMKLYGPKQEMLVDIKKEPFTQFEKTLQKYQAQRPKRE